jgi:hypothetical protein
MELIRSAGLGWPAWPLQLVGSALLIGVMLIRTRDWNDRHVRLQFLGFVMVFCVVFNHRAERQSAVIAVCGMVVWYLASRQTAWRTVLFVVVYSLVVLSGSSLMPDAIKGILVPQLRFSIPLTILWLVMLSELILPRFGRQQLAEAG